MGKVLKEFLKWLLIAVIAEFFIWFFGSIFRTIKRAIWGS